MQDIEQLKKTKQRCIDELVEAMPTDNINAFVYEVHEVYRLLRPFAKLMGQVYGNEN